MFELQKKLKELRQELGKAADDMAKHAEAGGEEYTKAHALVKDLREKMARVEEAIAEQRSLEGTTNLTPANEPAGERGVAATVKEKAAPGVNFARITKALIHAKGIPQFAAQLLEKHYGPEGQQLAADVMARAMAAGSGPAGGFLIPEQHSREIIEMLRSRTIIRKAGPAYVGLPNGQLTMPSQEGGVSGEYVGELTDAPVEEITYGEMSLRARKLMVMVPVSNDLIRFADPSMDALVRDDILKGLAITEDRAFLRNQGLGNAPKGLRYWIKGSHVIPANVTVNLDNITADLGKLETALLNADTPMQRPTWFMAPRTLIYLKNLRTVNGELAFPELERSYSLAGSPNFILRGMPGFVSTSVPINLGGGTESEVYLADAAEMVIGEAMGLLIDASDQASFKQGSETISAFQRDMTLIRAISQHDFGLRHRTSGAALTGVTWGA